MQDAKKYRPIGFKFTKFTADDEEPNCMQCDHYCDNYDCCNKCGSEHGWLGYIRTELEEIKDTEKRQEKTWNNSR